MSKAKPNLAEKNRREEKVVEWTNAGYSVEQICEALRPQVSKGVVTGDRKARRSQITHVHWAHGKTLPDPEPYDWLTPPPVKVRPPYLIHSPFTRVQGLLAWLGDQNALARLPHNITEARAAGDGTWFTQGQVVLQDAIAYLQKMLAVMQDDKARQEAMQSGARDDLSKTRAYSPPNRGGNIGAPLPEQGIGVIPVRLYQILWAYWYAGFPMTDEMVSVIAAKEGHTEYRVREAMQDFLASFDAGS